MSQHPVPTDYDIWVSVEDTRYFHGLVVDMITGQQDKQQPEVIRRNFRAFLHCWKSVIDFVKESTGYGREADGEKGTKKSNKWKNKWTAWEKDIYSAGMRSDVAANAIEVIECLIRTRNHDTHGGTIVVSQELALLTPLVFFDPPREELPERKELRGVCDVAMNAAEILAKTYKAHFV